MVIGRQLTMRILLRKCWYCLASETGLKGELQGSPSKPTFVEKMGLNQLLRYF
jgi:hypothetical protein